MKKYTKVLSVVIALIFTINIFALSSFAKATNPKVSSQKQNIWTTISIATNYEKSGQLDKALPLWLQIIDYYENRNTNKDDWTNSAIFHKKAGKYYDSIKDYNNAVYHYEKENEFWTKLGNNWGSEDLIRADKIRTTIEFYKKTTEDINVNLAKYEPKNGMYYGIYSENDKAIMQNLHKTKDVYGKHEIYLFYQHLFHKNESLDNEFPSDLAKEAKDAEGALQIALEPDDGLEYIRESKTIIKWAKKAKESDIPIFLRFMGEMNGDWVKWNGKPQLYKEKFKLVHDIMAKHAPNVVMVWCPNDVPTQDSKGYKIEDYYPGDEYVDWVGVNFYIDYYDSGIVGSKNNYMQNPIDHIKYVYDRYSAKKPIMICETGVSHYSIPDRKDLTNWGVSNLEQLYANLPIVYPRVKVITYFSLNQGNDNYQVGNRWNNYALSENESMHKMYNSLVDMSYHVNEIGGSSNFTFKKLNDANSIKTAGEIFGIFKIPDYKISKVEYYVDGKLISTNITLPYSFKYNLNNAKKLTVKIYDSNNILAVQKEIQL